MSNRSRRLRGTASQFGPRGPHSPAVDALYGLGDVGFTRFQAAAAQSPVLVREEPDGESQSTVAELEELAVAVRNEQAALEVSGAALVLAAIAEAAAAAPDERGHADDGPSPTEALLGEPDGGAEWHLQVIHPDTHTEPSEDDGAGDRQHDQAEEQSAALDRQAAEIGRLEAEGEQLRGGLLAAERSAAIAQSRADEYRAAAEVAAVALRREALQRNRDHDAESATQEDAVVGDCQDEEGWMDETADEAEGDGCQDDDHDDDGWQDDDQDAHDDSGADIFAGLPTAPRGETTGRRWPRLAAVGAGLALAAGAAVVLTGGGIGDGGGQAPVAEPAPAVSERSVGPVTMTVWRGIGLPVSAIAGPRDQGDAVGGFEQSTLGAAIAAAHLSVRLDPAVGPAVFNPVIDTHVVGDVERLRTSVTRQYDAEAQAAGVTAGSPLATAPGSILAYRLDGEAAQGAVTAHLLVAAGGAETDFGVPLRWEDGDWRVVSPDQGPFFTVAAVEGDSTDYTPFEGTVQ